jgi:hypothetical protein
LISIKESGSSAVLGGKHKKSAQKSDQKDAEKKEGKNGYTEVEDLPFRMGDEHDGETLFAQTDELPDVFHNKKSDF